VVVHNTSGPHLFSTLQAFSLQQLAQQQATHRELQATRPFLRAVSVSECHFPHPVEDTAAGTRRKFGHAR
jgi:hypothetical protein